MERLDATCKDIRADYHCFLVGGSVNSNIYALDDFEYLSTTGLFSDSQGLAILLDGEHYPICPVSAIAFSAVALLKIVPNAKFVRWVIHKKVN